MMDRLHGDAALGRQGALSNTIRNRLVAFGPIAVALIGIGIMAAIGGRDQATLIGATTTIDSIITGSVPAISER